MGERFRTRAMVVPRALATRLRRRGARGEVRRALVAHNLLLGDTFMLTPLLAKLRERHPQAEVVLLAAPSVVPLYEHRPYGVRALPFKPADASTTQALLREDPFDVAFVPGDNRYSWLAAAMGARHVVAHAAILAPRATGWWTRSSLSRPTLAPGATWSPSSWRARPGPMRAATGQRPAHALSRRHRAPTRCCTSAGARRSSTGSRSAGRRLPRRWRREGFRSRGVPAQARKPWCARGSRRAHASYAGRLDLPQLWRLVEGARSHCARYGRGAPRARRMDPDGDPLRARLGHAGGLGDFWRETPGARGPGPVPLPRPAPALPARVEWVRRCGRTLQECPEPRCMHAIEVGEVLAAVGELGSTQGPFLSLNQGTSDSAGSPEV
jgi:hypothetical protein